jgi:hypothetical protein
MIGLCRLLSAKMMTPSAFQLPPRNVSVSAVIVTDGPPSTSIFFKALSAVDPKAT